jgi:hypothetical protein
MAMSVDPIEIALLATPRELSMRGRTAFEVGIIATNRGTTTVEPHLDLARLLIDGHDSLQWSEAIVNGAAWTSGSVAIVAAKTNYSRGSRRACRKRGGDKRT